MTAARTVVFTGGGTGGHLYPGIAIARALRALRPEVQPFFVGAQRGIERDVLPTTEFPHLLLDLHPLYRPRVWQNWRTLRGALASWGRLDAMARERRPVAVVGPEGTGRRMADAYRAGPGGREDAMSRALDFHDHGPRPRRIEAANSGKTSANGRARAMSALVHRGLSDTASRSALV